MEEKKPTTVGGQPTGDITESGNPTHNSDGTFGSDSSKDLENLGFYNEEKNTSSNISEKLKSKLLNKINKKKEDAIKHQKDTNISGLSDDEILENIQKLKNTLNDDFLVSNISSLSLEDKINDLSAKYDENLLKKASETEIELLSLYSAVKAQENEILNEQASLNQFQFENIWKDQIVTAKNYIEKLPSIDGKKKYYQEQLSILNNDPEYESAIKWLQNKIENLNFFEELGKKYEILDDKYFNLKSNYNFEELENVATKFVGSEYAYSKERKDKATWFNTGSVNKNEDLATKHFGSQFEQMWATMNNYEQSAIVDYTSGYSKYNEPLRAIGYSGMKSFSDFVGGNFVDAVKNMTSAIDKCVWNEDIWVQRGINKSTKFIKAVGEKKGISINEMSDEQLQALVGTTFEDQGFASAGAAKGTGFSDNGIILNIYCPKGTKMAYMNTKGHYSYTHENEMILQRGYSYRITKVEKKTENGWYEKFYIDCEVILDSDKNKWSDEELNKIQKQYGGSHW